MSIAITHAIDLYSELIGLGLNPRIVEGRMALDDHAPAELLPFIKKYREELIEIITAIYESAPGVCSKCGRSAEDLFQAHSGAICVACVGELLAMEGYVGETA